MANTIAALLLEARAIMQDVIPTGSVDGTRYSNQDLLDAFNDAMLQARAKRPDLYLDLGMRSPVPRFTADDLTGGTEFPLDPMVYPAFLYYVVGRSEMRDDSFADDKRAETMLAKFVGQLMQVSS